MGILCLTEDNVLMNVVFNTVTLTELQVQTLLLNKLTNSDASNTQIDIQITIQLCSKSFCYKWKQNC